MTRTPEDKPGFRPEDVPIRDAATLIVIRDRKTRPAVLMGQRGAAAVFMPMKFVFPGGAVDRGDGAVPLAGMPGPVCTGRLSEDSRLSPEALAAAAIRELWEETGQILGRAADWTDPAPGWGDFATRGFVPDAGAMRYVFRAITPVGRARRFDARFFATEAENLATDPDDFGAATDELAHLQWVPLERIPEFDLPLITTVVLEQVMAGIDRDGPPEELPVFRNGAEAELAARRGIAYDPARD